MASSEVCGCAPVSFPVSLPALDRKRGPGNNASAVWQACLSYTSVAQPHNMDSLHQHLKITALEEDILNGVKKIRESRMHT